MDEAWRRGGAGGVGDRVTLVEGRSDEGWWKDAGGGDDGWRRAVDEG